MILINDLILPANIGITEKEKATKQLLKFNLEIGSCLKKAAKTDLISDTVDYFQITQAIKEIVGNSSYNLLEALAEDIIEIIFINKGVESVKLTILKLEAINELQSVGVSLYRMR